MLDFKPFQTVKISTVISYKYLKSLFFYSYFPIPPQQTHEALDNGGFKLSSNGKVCNSKGVVLGYSKSKHSFIKYLEENDVNLKVNSDTLLPDDAFINIRNKTIYIIEKKFQNVAGSVDEKLQTCLYKKLQYKKLVSQIGYEIEYVYVLNNWFKQTKYRDVLSYIEYVGCSYFFDELPLWFLGL